MTSDDFVNKVMVYFANLLNERNIGSSVNQRSALEDALNEVTKLYEINLKKPEIQEKPTIQLSPYITSE